LAGGAPGLPVNISKGLYMPGGGRREDLFFHEQKEIDLVSLHQQ